MPDSAIAEKVENKIAPKRRDALRMGICGIGRAGLGMIQREAVGPPGDQDRGGV